jgi:long-chain acyl-CoA synthetase
VGSHGRNIPAMPSMPRTLADTAAEDPNKPALIDATNGEFVTYGQLDERSARISSLLASFGLRTGDHIAVLMDNVLPYFDVCWAAMRSGLYITPINWHLNAEEAGYIVEDCGARVLFASTGVAALAKEIISAHTVEHCLSIGDDIEGFLPLTEALKSVPVGVVALPALEGGFMFYSSGTTGRPKGILRPLTNAPYGVGGTFEPLITGLYGFDGNTTYLCPAPLYHAAPIAWSMGTQRFGGTVVLMKNFDAIGALEAIERFRITHAQFVPTMFVRMLKLNESDRKRADLSSLKVAIHAAAPCPVDVKTQMIEWWGPIIEEYYAGSEGNGFCRVDSKTWLAHPGTVGQPVLGRVHILDEDGEALPVGEIGTVWFAGTAPFEYHNDQAKTASAFNARGWSTLNDVGHVDDEGFVYLSDRRSHLIISGGVNVYPQEVENVLTMHPRVADVAVIGVPDAEMGEAVKAVVQLANPSDATPEVSAELIAFCRERLAHFKCPRSVDFDDDLPRLPTGKLFKRRLIDRYR